MKSKAEQYKAWIRTLACLVDEDCFGHVESHHLVCRGMGGNSEPWKDFSCVPLCVKHHDEVGKIGVRTFGKRYPWVDLWKSVKNLREEFMR